MKVIVACSAVIHADSSSFESFRNHACEHFPFIMTVRWPRPQEVQLPARHHIYMNMAHTVNVVISHWCHDAQTVFSSCGRRKAQGYFCFHKSESVSVSARATGQSGEMLPPQLQLCNRAYRRIISSLFHCMLAMYILGSKINRKGVWR